MRFRACSCSDMTARDMDPLLTNRVCNTRSWAAANPTRHADPSRRGETVRIMCQSPHLDLTHGYRKVGSHTTLSIKVDPEFVLGTHATNLFEPVEEQQPSLCHDTCVVFWCMGEGRGSPLTAWRHPVLSLEPMRSLVA